MAEQDKPKIYKVPEGRGMKIRRMIEIQDAETAGTPMELSPEERIQYDEALEQSKKVSGFMASQFGVISKQISGILESSLPKPTFRDHLANFPPRPVIPPTTDYSKVLSAPRKPSAEVKRELRNANNIEATAAVMGELLEVMKDQAVAAAERDQEAKATATKNFKLAIWTLVAAVAAILVPLAVEIGKAAPGWMQALGWL